MPFAVTYTFSDGPGHTASGAQVSQNFTDLATAAEALFTTYRLIHEGRGNLVNAVANTYLAQTGAPITNALLASGNAGVATTMFHLDPARYAITGRATKLILRVAGAATLTGPGTTMTFGLYPITTFSQDPAFNPRVDALGTVVSGSPAAIATPAASVAVTASSSEFTFPSAGAYALAVVNSGTMAASTGFAFTVWLEMRHV